MKCAQTDFIFNGADGICYPTFVPSPCKLTYPFEVDYSASGSAMEYLAAPPDVSAWG